MSVNVCVEEDPCRVNGFGVIGKRVAAAVALQEDMSLAGVSDVVTGWRANMVTRNGFRLFCATGEHMRGVRAARLEVTGTLDDLLGQADVDVDSTPKHIAAENTDGYRRRGLKFIFQDELCHGAQSRCDARRVVQHDVHRADPGGAQTGPACFSVQEARCCGAARDRHIGKPRERDH